MSKLFLFLSFLFFINNCCSGASIAEASDTYATVEFEKPQSQAALEYLGLAGDKKTFTLEEIKAPVLVVEVFSVSCRHCQGAAKHFEALYELVQKKGLSEKIKIIGIAIQNSNLEVDVYRKKFNVQFPLVADPGYEAYRIVGRKVAIPHVSVLRRDDNGKFDTVYSKPRETREGKDMFETVLKTTGLSAQGE